MIAVGKFKGVTEVKRNGVVDKVIIPAELANNMTHEINVDEKEKAVIMDDGDSVCVLTDKFGIREETIVNAIFVNGGVILEIVVGNIYLEDKGTVFSVNELEDIEYPQDLNKIEWLTTDKLLEYARIGTANKYGVKDKDLLEEYVNNLAFSFLLENVDGRKRSVSDYFRIKYEGYFTDLGIGLFTFASFMDDEYLKQLEAEEEDLDDVDLDYDEDDANDEDDPYKDMFDDLDDDEDGNELIGFTIEDSKIG